MGRHRSGGEGFGWLEERWFLFFEKVRWAHVFICFQLELRCVFVGVMLLCLEFLFFIYINDDKCDINRYHVFFEVEYNLLMPFVLDDCLSTNKGMYKFGIVEQPETLSIRKTYCPLLLVTRLTVQKTLIPKVHFEETGM